MKFKKILNYLLLLLLAIGAMVIRAPSFVYAENADDRPYPPIMMVLVDTSESMGRRRDPHANMYSAINAIVGDGTTAGVLPSYQYEVKFGFAGMAYGENGLYGRQPIAKENGIPQGVAITDTYKTRYKSGIVATKGYEMDLEWCEEYFTDEDIQDCINGPDESGTYKGYYTGTNSRVQTSKEFKACANPLIYYNNGKKIKTHGTNTSNYYHQHKCVSGFNNNKVGTTYTRTDVVKDTCAEYHYSEECKTWCTKFKTGCQLWNKRTVCDLYRQPGECKRQDYRWFCKNGSGEPCATRTLTYKEICSKCTDDDCKTPGLKNTDKCETYYAGCKRGHKERKYGCTKYRDPDECKSWQWRNTTCAVYNCDKYATDEHGSQYCKKWASTCKTWNQERYCAATWGPNQCVPGYEYIEYDVCDEYYQENTECQSYVKEAYCVEKYPPNSYACHCKKEYYYYCNSGNWTCDEWEYKLTCVERETKETCINSHVETTSCATEYGTGPGQIKECYSDSYKTSVDTGNEDQCIEYWSYKDCKTWNYKNVVSTYVDAPYTYKPTCREFGCKDYHKEDAQTVARLLYPTVSDDPEDIYNANSNIKYYVDRYDSFADTPIGPALADLWYLFGCTSGTDCLYEDADPGLVRQYINGNEMKDTHYQCRKKAAILVTDGEPCCNYPKDPNGNSSKQSTAGLWYEDEPDNISLNTHGHYSVDGYDEEKNAWIDAYHLYKAKIPVYAVAYAMEGLDPSKSGNAGELLNKIALYGGTCKDPETMLLLDPEDGTGPGSDYYKMVYDNKKLDENGIEIEKSLTDKICFYNAQDGDALRRALVTALSDMLKSTVSKTKIANTSYISMKNNVVNGSYNNGYYNVYSGYELSNGPVRKTKLERTATICNHSTGKFEYDESQFMDIAQRLACRLSDDCQKSVKNNDSGLFESVSDTDTRLLLSNREGCSNRGNDSVREFELKNDCLRQRYIFSGDYSYDRFKLYPSIVSLAANTNGSPHIGIVKDAIVSGTKDSKIISNGEFFTRIENSNQCAIDKLVEYGRPIVKTTTPCTTVAECSTYTNPSCVNGFCETYGSTVNYVLSPYECVQDVDCGMKGGVPNRCDLGRCVSNDKFYSPTGDNDDIIKIGGQNRKKYNQCTNHQWCEDNEFHGKIKGNTYVCHSGRCLPGTIKSCDIRQFMATVPLGTIEYASPVPVNPPRRSYKSKSYSEFSKKYWLRDTMLLVGSNDGMLHAFVLGDNVESNNYTNKSSKYSLSEEFTKWVDVSNKPIIEEGDELWSFIPKSLYNKLHRLVDFGAQNMVNASPTVADVQIPIKVAYDKNADGSSKEYTDTEWRTVVVGGFGGSARGYYALDITDPANPHIIWEIDNQFTISDNKEDYPSMVNTTDKSDKDAKYNFIKNPDAVISVNLDKENRKADAKYPFILMGYSTSKPIITQMITDSNGTVEPVVILSGGTTHSTDLTDAEFNRLNRDDNDQTGKALYIVRLFPPKGDPSKLLVKAFYFDNRISGSPSVYPNNFNSVAQLIYVGDEKGKLYRLDVSNHPIDSNKSNWGSYEKLNFGGEFKNEKPAFDPYNGICQKTSVGKTEDCKFEAITFKPAVSLYDRSASGAIVQITFGTGRNTNLNVNDGIYNYVANFYDVPVSVNDHNEYRFNRFDDNDSSQEAMVYLFRRNEQDSTSNSSVNDKVNGYGKYSIYTNDPVSGERMSPLQKMTGDPITYNYISYFPSFITSSDDNNECTLGSAAIWRIGKSLKSYKGSYSIGNVQNVENIDAFTGNKITLPEGAKVYGMEITTQMYCRGDSNGSIASPQLVFQTGIEFLDIACDNGSKLLRGNGKNKLPTIESTSMNLDALKPDVSVITWASSYE